MFSKKWVSILAAVAALGAGRAWAQAGGDGARAIEPNGGARVPNTEGTYAALRSALPVGEGVTVKDLTLAREGGSFHFAQGSFFFYAPVNGRVTGAVFVGSGHFQLSPKAASEQHSLARLTKSETMAQDFSVLQIRFTDETAAEIRKASAGNAGAVTKQAAQAAADLARDFRIKLHENLELRLLEDVLRAQTEPGGFFLAAFRMGGTFTGRNVLFIVDPEGAPHVAPDQVELSTWEEDTGVQTWAAYTAEGRAGADGGLPIRVSAQKLDVAFEKSGAMSGSAETTIVVREEGLRVVRLDLFPTLRVSGVYAESGMPLDFVQERKEADAQFALLLPQPAKKGETLRVLTKYAGKDAVERDGDDVYYLRPAAREDWYPSGYDQFGNFAKFRMTFHLPKGLQIVATGKEVSREKEGGGLRVVWESGDPIAVAGFNLGNFASGNVKTPQGFEVEAYANVSPPDNVKSMLNRVQDDPMSGMALGNMSTVPALKGELAQGNAAIQVYSDFFGKLPYDHVALTQQSACDFGQSWPMLVYLPICAFWDTTIQNQLGLLNYHRSYWHEVTPHEVSHQWWGQLVGFKSYRDQWMSEGFANFSVGVYLLQTNPKMTEYREFWNEQRENLLHKNAMGMRPIDAGPLTMGVRVSNSKTGDVYQDLIYSKGAYVMHMLEMLYFTPQYKQAPFRQAMQNFVKEYSGKAATTEDLKASFEKTLPQWVDMDGNGKLDWFFDDYVYGIELPHYAITSDFSVVDGATTAHFKISQSNVSASFRMLVPVYLQMEKGDAVRLGNVLLRGSETEEQTLKLGKLPSPGKKLVLNYNADVLSD